MKNKIKPRSGIFLFIIIIAALCLIGWAAFGQTNGVPTAPAAPSPSPAALKVADDVRQLVVDLFTLGAGVSWSGLVLSVYLAAKGIRNRTPLGAGKLSGILNLLNLEAKPDAPAITTATAAPAASPKE